MDNKSILSHKQNADIDLKTLIQGRKQYDSKNRWLIVEHEHTQNNLIDTINGYTQVE